MRAENLLVTVYRCMDGRGVSVGILVMCHGRKSNFVIWYRSAILAFRAVVCLTEDTFCCWFSVLSWAFLEDFRSDCAVDIYQI